MSSLTISVRLAHWCPRQAKPSARRSTPSSSWSAPATAPAVALFLASPRCGPWRNQRPLTYRNGSPSASTCPVIDDLPHLLKRLIASRLQLPSPAGPLSLPAIPHPTPGSPPACRLPDTPHRNVRFSPPCSSRSAPQRHVMHIRRACRSYATNYSRLSVRTDVYLHPKPVPLIPLLRLTHLRVSTTSTILRRRRRLDEARVHDRPLPKPQSLGLQMTVDLFGQTSPQLVLFQQMTEVQDRRLVRQRACDNLSLRTVSPTRPRRACPPYQGHSGCRTTARSVSAASQTTHTAAGPGAALG